MMKIFISLFLILNLSTTSEFRKRTLSYGMMISNAELIVTGKVSSTSSHQYKFIVSDFLKGKSSQKIQVEIWEEWTCDKRIKPIKAEQELLLFLIPTKQNTYKVLNQSTGEIFIEKDQTLQTFMKSDFPVLSIVKEGIQLFLKTVEYHGTIEYNEDNYFKRLVPQSEIDRFIENNKFYEQIFEDLKYDTMK